MIRLQPHKRATFAGLQAGSSYLVRIPGPVGEQAAHIRCWINVYRRTAAASVKLNLKHSPIQDAATYLTYVDGVVDPGSSSATGLNTGVVDTDPVSGVGRPGAFLEVEMVVTGTSGAADVDCETFVEISPL